MRKARKEIVNKMLCEKEKCTGCMACYNACKFNAISLIVDENGMLRPIIDKEKCIQCGMCSKACPEKDDPKLNMIKKAYALYSKDPNDSKNCASAGVATTFYKYIIKAGGSVVGAGFDNEQKPILKVAKNIDAIDEFKGSKYVYVFPNTIYRDIKLLLSENEKCLFVGTPCQVAGLKKFLGKEYANLITVDLICHGTPPFDFLREHLLNVSQKKKITKYSFRGDDGWNLRIESEGKVIYKKSQTEDVYFTSFLKGLIHREVCYNCKYACKQRVSDITIGDFWGLSSDALNKYKGKVSVSLINTRKGQEFFDSVSDSFVFEERDIQEALNGNAQLNRPSIKHQQHDEFLKQYTNYMDFDEAIKHINILKEIKKNKIRNIVLKYPRKLKYFIKEKMNI